MRSRIKVGLQLRYKRRVRFLVAASAVAVHWRVHAVHWRVGPGPTAAAALLLPKQVHAEHSTEAERKNEHDDNRGGVVV